jgi:predicted transcriptional regulator
MRTQLINDFLNGSSVNEIGNALGITGSSVSQGIKTAVKNVKKQRRVRKDKTVFNAIKNDTSARDINNNRDAWKKAMQLFSATLGPTYLQPVTTIFKADDYRQAFDIAERQGKTLTAYEGALLMYNTIVANNKIKN